MTLCVAQTQGAHHPSADGVMGWFCATDQFSHNKGYLGHQPLALWWEQACYKTNMVRAYPVNKENEMERTIIIVLALFFPLPPAAAQDEGVFEGRPTDFLPLQVGNQWTYEQHYLNPYYNRYEIVGEVVRETDDWTWGGKEQFDLLSPNWTRIRAAWEIPGYPLTARYEPESPLFDLLDTVRELTIEITHTETIEGHEYFVFSEPYDWPPVPAVCLVGQKVRFSDEGVLLVRWQEQDIPLYDFAPPYTPHTYPTSVTKDYTTPAYPVLYDAHDPVALPLTIRRYFLSDRAFALCFRMNVASLPPYEIDNLGFVCFLPDYGLAKYDMIEFPDTGTFPSGWNTLYPVSAVIDGQVIEYPYSRTAPYPGYTHVQPTSWGQLKARYGQRP